MFSSSKSKIYTTTTITTYLVKIYNNNESHNEYIKEY